MYLKHGYLHQRRSHVKSVKKRITLSQLNATLRCYALILKMARLRFPGRPGQRIGRTYVKYAYDDLKIHTETCSSVHQNIKSSLQLFYELFGYSDEEEEFEGFTPEDIAQAEAVYANRLKQKQTIEKVLDPNNASSLPSGSEIDKLISSDSETSSSSSVRRERGMRDILRKSYDKMIKDGFSKSSPSSSPSYVNKASLNMKTKHIIKANTQCRPSSLKLSPSVESIKSLESSSLKSDSKRDCDSPSEPKCTLPVTRILRKGKHQVRTRRRRRAMKPNVKKKFRSRFLYRPTGTYLNLRQKLTPIKEDESYKVDSQGSRLLENSNLSNASGTDSNITRNHQDSLKPKARRTYLKNKRFVLPSMSARSSRKIIPRKRYMEDYDLVHRKDEDSQCSRSSISGSSEAISAMDGESSPEDSALEDSRHTKKLQKKAGLLDKSLVIEGKRAWKPSLKVQMKLSQMNCEYPFALKKSSDDSSGTSSGSFKDIIKPDMVSKYAEKMAQKPKERPFKMLESFRRKPSYGVRSEVNRAVVKACDNLDGDKKPGDKLEKVAAKIEKLLKSQWEGRLKDPQPFPSIQSNLTVSQWMQQQRASSQKRTKSIIRKARLQLKKKNLNLRTRKSNQGNSTGENNLETNSMTPTLMFDKKDMLALTSHSKSSQNDDVPLQNLSGVVSTDEVLSTCVICSFSAVQANVEKSYEEFACDVCHKFFEAFIKSPKQYFCSKDGDCVIENSKEPVSRKSINLRCKACWLKICMERLTVPATVKEQIAKYVPRLNSPPHNPIFTAEEKNEEISPTVDGQVLGPRIKHVCRRAAVALGLPRATFSSAVESKDVFNLSALPQKEKQKILEAVPVEEKMIVDETALSHPENKIIPAKRKPIKQSVKKKARKDLKVRNRVLLKKKSSLLIHKEQKRRKLLMKKSTKHKQSFKKSLKVGRKSQMKKTLKFSYKSAVKTSVKTSPKVLSSRPMRGGKIRKVRCKQCEGCLAEDCGTCTYCLDKKKFGGPNLIKQACLFRRCLQPILPSTGRRKQKSAIQGNDRNRPSGGSNFGGGGPSGLGLSLSSSSSSPTSPDSSSGSSCSTSSSSSSSGSSGSSSSSTTSRSSSSSTSSSSSDNLKVSHNNLLNNSRASLTCVQNVVQAPLVTECTDSNVVTNPIFQQAQTLSSENSLPVITVQETEEDTVSSESSHLYNDSLDSTEDNEDTIVYEESSSIIELKNASFDPSLVYGAALGDNDCGSYSYSSYGGSKGQSSRQGGSEYRKQHNRNQDQYGSAGSGSQESNGDEDDDDEEDEQDGDSSKKHHIYANYWGDYDCDKIASQGYALISSQQIPLPCACYLCGCAGQEKLIFCVLCCEPYHTFCLSDEDAPHEENIENWCCKKCQCCAVCGFKQNLLKCRKCQDTYHPECLIPHYPAKPSKKKNIWMCPKCVKCKSCGSTPSNTLGTGISWNFDSLLCHTCSRLTDKGIDCF